MDNQFERIAMSLRIALETTQAMLAALTEEVKELKEQIKPKPETSGWIYVPGTPGCESFSNTWGTWTVTGTSFTGTKWFYYTDRDTNSTELEEVETPDNPQPQIDHQPIVASGMGEVYETDPPADSSGSPSVQDAVPKAVEYPHVCPACGWPAYIGLSRIDCTNGDCPRGLGQVPE